MSSFRMLAAVMMLLALAGCAGQNGQEDAGAAPYSDAQEVVKGATYSNMTANEFKDALGEKDFFLVDTHIPEQEHIAGTDAFIPYNEIMGRLGELPADKDAKIVLYCRSGSMSELAAKELAAFGYTNVYSVVGGKKAFDST